MDPRLLWAYFGPETTLPLASVLGAVIGVLLMGWYFILGFIKKLVRICLRTGSDAMVTAVPSQPVHVDATPDEATAGGANGLSGNDRSAV